MNARDIAKHFGFKWEPDEGINSIASWEEEIVSKKVPIFREFLTPYRIKECFVLSNGTSGSGAKNGGTGKRQEVPPCIPLDDILKVKRKRRILDPDKKWTPDPKNVIPVPKLDPFAGKFCWKEEANENSGKGASGGRSRKLYRQICHIYDILGTFFTPEEVGDDDVFIALWFYNIAVLFKNSDFAEDIARFLARAAVSFMVSEPLTLDEIIAYSFKNSIVFFAKNGIPKEVNFKGDLAESLFKTAYASIDWRTYIDMDVDEVINIGVDVSLAGPFEEELKELENILFEYYKNYMTSIPIPNPLTPTNKGDFTNFKTGIGTLRREMKARDDIREKLIENEFAVSEVVRRIYEKTDDNWFKFFVFKKFRLFLDFGFEDETTVFKTDYGPFSDEEENLFYDFAYAVLAHEMGHAVDYYQPISFVKGDYAFRSLDNEAAREIFADIWAFESMVMDKVKGRYASPVFHIALSVGDLSFGWVYEVVEQVKNRLNAGVRRGSLFKGLADDVLKKCLARGCRTFGL